MVKQKILTIFIVSSFIGLAVFGFLLMHSSSKNYIGLCVAVLSGNTGFCPNDNLASAYFHINAFHNFSNILPGVFVIFLILTATFFIIFGLFVSKRRETALFSPGIPVANTNSLFVLAVSLGKWLTLREREAEA